MTGAELSLLGAFVGGLLSFLSPCVLPVVPAYVSVVTGLSVTSVQEGGREHLGQVLKTSLGFVLGFSVVFVLLGLSVTAAGGALLANKVLLTRVSGACPMINTFALALGTSTGLGPSGRCSAQSRQLRIWWWSWVSSDGIF